MLRNCLVAFVVVALLDPNFFERVEGANVFRDETVRCRLCVHLYVMLDFQLRPSDAELALVLPIAGNTGVGADTQRE